MLLVPMGSQPAGQVLGHALDHGAALLRAGPVEGSYVIAGRRDDIARAVAGTGSVLLAAPAGICGKGRVTK